MHDAQKAQTKRTEQLRRLPGGAHPQHLPQNQAQVQGSRVNQQALGDVVHAAQVHPLHAAGVVQMGEASLHPFPATSHQRLGGPALQPPPVGIHRRLRRVRRRLRHDGAGVRPSRLKPKNSRKPSGSETR